MMLISSWSLPHNDKGLGRKLAVDGLAHPNVAKSNTTPLISNHKLHPKVIVASSANVFMLRQLGVAHGPTTTEDRFLDNTMQGALIKVLFNVSAYHE